MKKKTLRIILGLIFALLIGGGITRYILNNGTKYEYNEDGTLRQEYTLRNGKIIGDAITYYKNGEKRLVDTYNENGKNLETIYYNCAIEDWYHAEDYDPCDYHYISERRIYSESYDFYEIERIDYDKDGNIVNDYIANGENTHYYRNGKIRTKGNRIGGIEDGIWINYDMSGKEIGKCTYDRGNKISGICMDSNPFEVTNKVEICEYKNNLRDGECKKYDYDGNLVIVDHYKDNKRDGELIIYNEDGSISYKGTYKNGNLVE